LTPNLPSTISWLWIDLVRSFQLHSVGTRTRRGNPLH